MASTSQTQRELDDQLLTLALGSHNQIVLQRLQDAPHATKHGGLFDGFNLLHCAALRGNDQLAHALLATHPELANAKNARGKRPADIARDKGHATLASLIDSVAASAPPMPSTGTPPGWGQVPPPPPPKTTTQPQQATAVPVPTAWQPPPTRAGPPMPSCADSSASIVGSPASRQTLVGSLLRVHAREDALVLIFPSPNLEDIFGSSPVHARIQRITSDTGCQVEADSTEHNDYMWLRGRSDAPDPLERLLWEAVEPLGVQPLGVSWPMSADETPTEAEQAEARDVSGAHVDVGAMGHLLVVGMASRVQLALLLLLRDAMEKRMATRLRAFAFCTSRQIVGEVNRAAAYAGGRWRVRELAASPLIDGGDAAATECSSCRALLWSDADNARDACTAAAVAASRVSASVLYLRGVRLSTAASLPSLGWIDGIGGMSSCERVYEVAWLVASGASLDAVRSELASLESDLRQEDIECLRASCFTFLRQRECDGALDGAALSRVEGYLASIHSGPGATVAAADRGTIPAQSRRDDAWKYV